MLIPRHSIQFEKSLVLFIIYLFYLHSSSIYSTFIHHLSILPSFIIYLFYLHPSSIYSTFIECRRASLLVTSFCSLFASCFIPLSIFSVANVRGCERVFLLCLPPLFDALDRDSLEFLFQNNLSTIKEFLKMLIDPLREEINQLKGDNDELRRSLEFTQAELTEMRKTCGIRNGERQVNAVSHTEKRELLERVRNLEDLFTKEQFYCGGITRRERRE